MNSYRQKYHLEPPVGLMNDPNGFCHYQGRYHLFFQWNRFAKDHTHKEWGHFSSPDLVHWDLHYGALLPDQPYDHSGVHSGSALVVDDELLLFYTGSDKGPAGRRSHQCLASTTEARTFIKEGVVAESPEGFTGHVRDPKVFRVSDGSYRMLLGAQRSCGKGAAILFASDDTRTWKYARTIAMDDEHEMCECPDLLDLNGQHVLMWCPQHRDNAHDIGGSSYSCYKAVHFDERANRLDDEGLEGGAFTDAGFDFYAPQTMVTEDGRTLMVGWMDRLNDAQEQALAATGPSVGCLTVPRELSWSHGRLRQLPVRELADLRGTEGAWLRDGEDALVCQPASRAFWMSVERSDGGSFLIDLNGGSERLAYDEDSGELTLSRTDWVSGCVETRTTHADAITSLELLSDQSSIEVFANEGSVVMSARVLPKGTDASVRVRGLQGSLPMRLWNIKRMQ